MHIDEALELGGVLGGDPARAIEVGGQESHLCAVLVREAMHRYFELELADRAEDRRAAVDRMEDLDRAFLAELVQPGLQLLALERGRELHAPEYLGREE